MSSLRHAWDRHDWLRRTVRTFAQVFVAVFAVALLGWLADVQQWTTEGGTFPDPSVLGKAAVAGLAAAAASVVTAVQNWLEDRGVVRARK